MTGGRYFGANDTEGLMQVLGEAVETAGLDPIEEEGTGWLEVKGADLRGHDVHDAESGEIVKTISSVNSIVDLPAGIYNITIGPAMWKSIEVKNGETTVLDPGHLTVESASFRGHAILEAETGEEHGNVSSLAQTIALMPGEYLVTFGKLHWPIKLEAGQSLILKPGVISVDGASYRGHTIWTADGREVGYVSNTAASMTLPPGEYTVDVGGKAVPFTLKEGEHVTIENK